MAASTASLAEPTELAVIVVLVLVLAIIIGRRQAQRRATGRAPRRQAQPTTPELQEQASRDLVETDDAVRASDQELSFAVARFGEHATATFSAALNEARSELAEAFKIRQLLDDNVPETEPIRRSMLTEISARCAAANRLLDEQAQAFDRLQDLQTRAPKVVAEVEHHVTQQTARVDRATQTLSQLGAKYTTDAVATVSASPREASERLDQARTRLAGVRQALADEQSKQAAVFLQAAESEADEAESLLDSIEHLEAELTQAASALPAALREIDVEIAEATGLLTDRPGNGSATLAQAEAAAADVRGQMASGRPFDALAALRQLEESDATLDHALATARQARDRQDRAMAVLDQAMLVARSAITAAGDYIATRRPGTVGARARTRLAEAHRHFELAITHAQDNPEVAVNEAQQADALAQQARGLAEHDIATLVPGQAGQPGSEISGSEVGAAAGFRGAHNGGPPTAT